MEQFLDSVADFFQKGGNLMYVNLLVSVIVITLIVDRINALHVRNKLPREQFMQHILGFINKDRISEALKMCRQTPDSALARVVAAGLSRADKGGAQINAGIEAAILDVNPDLKKRTPVLWSLANISTLIGLIGTIMGLIGAFAAMSATNISAEDRPRILGDAIAHAMNNTAFGLGIAVCCMIAHVFLDGQKKKILEDIERYSVQLENSLIFRDQTKGS